MSKEKQIEEMAKAIDEFWKGTIGANFKESFLELFAVSLYSKGYRKQSEGEWIFEHEYYGKMLCSNCNGEALVNECSEYVDSDFCPNCGARMKGYKGHA